MGFEQGVHDRLDMATKALHAMRRECYRTDSTQAGMNGRIHEEHLPNHGAADLAHGGQSDLFQMFWLGSALCRKAAQDGGHVFVARNHPGMQKRIPVDRILLL